MHTNRRNFVKLAAATGAGLAISGVAHATHRGAQRVDPPATPAPSPTPKADKPLHLLILGGTAFLGPEVVAAAQARGHTITLFNRGKTRPNLFPDLEKLHGDRDPSKGDGLKALEGRKFDAVIDNSGYFPRHVKAGAELLAPSIGHYLFISTISVYKDPSKLNQDESAPVGTIDDPTVENMGSQMQNYGPLKALCEQAAEKAMPGRCTVIRPGFIVGPGDWTGRFNYWPLRMRDGGEVLAPGNAADPVQIIDVRDLAEWMVHCVESKITGTYNACGPKERLTWGKCLMSCQRVTKSDASLTWVDSAWLQENAPGDNFPIWAPSTGDTAGFHTWSNARATANGLKFRSVDATVTGLLDWYKDLTPEQQKKFVAGISRDREAELLKLWKARKA